MTKCQEIAIDSVISPLRLSLCGGEFVFKNEIREKEGAAEVKIERVTEIILYGPYMFTIRA